MRTTLVTEPHDPDAPALEFEVDADAGELTYAFVGSHSEGAMLRGFAPPGWDVPPWRSVEPPHGVVPVSPADVANLLDGLGWVDIQANGASHRARIARRDPIPAAFESDWATSTLIGVCSRRLTVTGLFSDLPVTLQPAVVTIARSPAEEKHGRLRAVNLAVDVACGGGHVPGIGDVGVEVFAAPGAVVARTPAADFPADMLLTICMRFHTPLGPITGEPEHYVGESIPRFPPFGAALRPVKERIGLRNAAGACIGELALGPLVPLFHAGAEGVPHEMPCRS